eukprot:PhF_6_TR34133/c0_g1_i3/m.49839
MHMRDVRLGRRFQARTKKAMKWGGIPWVQHNESDVLPYTHYAQWVLSRAMTNKTSCATEKILLQRFSNNGFGADVDLMGWSVLHAKKMGRVLVFEDDWKWRKSKKCSSWECYFALPSPCTMEDVTYDSYRAHQVYNYIGHDHVGYRVIHKLSANIRDYGFRTDAELLPPGITKEDLVELLPKNMTYERWQMAQGVKYLMRYVQPWVRDMMMRHINLPSSDKHLKTLRLKGVGDTTNIPVIGMHFRSGDKGKVLEFATAFSGCGEFHVDLQATIADILAIRNKLQRVKYFISFDQPQTMWWIKHRVKMNQQVEATIPTEVIHAAFNWSDTITGEARTAITRQHGFKHLMEITLINLYLAVALPVAWVNNDHSSWSRLINTLRITSGKARCPYVDLYHMYWNMEVGNSEVKD